MYDDSSIFLERKKEIACKFIQEFECGNKKERTKLSSYIGVSYDRSRKMWKATGGKKQLGRFKTEQEAHKRRIKWEIQNLQQSKELQA
jgi:hypothetical protein